MCNFSPILDAAGGFASALSSVFKAPSMRILQASIFDKTLGT